jgi:hypothetical protein
MPKLLPGISLRSGRTDSAGTSIESTVHRSMRKLTRPSQMPLEREMLADQPKRERNCCVRFRQHANNVTMPF